MAYPAGAVRLTAANNTWAPAFLHKDHLGSVRAISGAGGTPEERTLYRPYGGQTEVASAIVNDDKSWLGERYDAGAGLQYLNARYYDPELAMFLQPDWFEVTWFGVGTNRYSYSFGDPVNFSDPGGNLLPLIGVIVGCGGGGCEAALAGLGAAMTAIIGMDLVDNGVVDGSPGRDLVDVIGNVTSDPIPESDGYGNTGGAPEELPGTNSEGFTPHGDPTGITLITEIESGPQVGISAIRGINNPKPVKEAEGPHSTWSVDEKGNIKSHAEWRPNPQNPSGHDMTRRVDLQGREHTNTNGEKVPTPHEHTSGEKNVKPVEPRDRGYPEPREKV